MPSTVMAAEPAMPEMAAEATAIGISVQHSSIYVTGAAGRTLEVVSLAGRHVATIRIESPSQRVELNIPKGCYILKIDNIVRKVTIR